MIKDNNIRNCHRRWEKFVRFNLRRLAVVLVVFAAIIGAAAQDLRYLPLRNPGQASVTIDRGTKTAYIVDLGNANDGDKVEIDGAPLIKWIAEQGVEHLVFVCSHPHADHGGAIKKLFEVQENKSPFLKAGAGSPPRFNQLTFIDNGVPGDLKLLQAWNAGPAKLAGIKAEYISAAEGNAFASISQKGNKASKVFIENIPYEATTAGAHGNSVVTRMVLGNGHVHVDFDDANSAVIREVVRTLKDRGDLLGEKHGDRYIDSFVVPHHASSVRTDIEAILALKPQKAVIAVNPGNQYGHPAPEILTTLIEHLGAKNVVFTGSQNQILFGPEGIEGAPLNASLRRAFNLYVVPIYRGRQQDATYRNLSRIMSEGGGGSGRDGRQNPGDDNEDGGPGGNGPKPGGKGGPNSGGGAPAASAVATPNSSGGIVSTRDNAGRSGRVDSVQREQSMNRVYQRFEKQNYPTEASRSFINMKESTQGFGGIVLGSVVDSVGVPPLKSLRWVPGDTQDAGYLYLKFRDGSSRTFSPVRAEDLAAAIKVLASGSSNGKPTGPDEGIGLVSLTRYPGGAEFREGQLRTGEHGPVIVHPALTGFQLANNLVVDDSLPSGPKLLIKLLSGVRNPGRLPSEKFLNQFTQSTYRIVDVPMRLQMDSEHVTVRAVAQGRPDAVEPLIEILFSRTNSSKMEVSKDYSAYFPSLINASADYRRLNEFVATLALVRWAQRQGITCVPPRNLRRTNTANWFTRSDEGISLGWFENWGEVFQSTQERVAQRLYAMRNRAVPALQPLIKQEEGRLAAMANARLVLQKQFSAYENAAKPLAKVCLALVTEAAKDKAELAEAVCHVSWFSPSNFEHPDNILKYLDKITDLKQSAGVAALSTPEIVNTLPKVRSLLVQASAQKEKLAKLSQSNWSTDNFEAAVSRSLDPSLQARFRAVRREQQSPVLTWLQTNPAQAMQLENASRDWHVFRNSGPAAGRPATSLFQAGVAEINKTSGRDRANAEHSFLSKAKSWVPALTPLLSELDDQVDRTARLNVIASDNHTRLIETVFPDFLAWRSLSGDYSQWLKGQE